MRPLQWQPSAVGCLMAVQAVILLGSNNIYVNGQSQNSGAWAGGCFSILEGVDTGPAGRTVRKDVSCSNDTRRV